MKREILRGRSVDDVQTKVDRVRSKGWYPVSDVKEDSSYYEPAFVCVVETQNSNSKLGKTWGERFHLN